MAVIALTLLAASWGLRGGGVAAPAVADLPWVIPAGKEAASLALATRVARALDADVRDVLAQERELRVQLDGGADAHDLAGAPAWVQPPGGVLLTTRDGHAVRVEVFGYDAAAPARVAAALQGADAGELWIQPAQASQGMARPTEGVDADGAWSGRWGILTPAIVWARAALGVSPGQLVVGWWTACALLTVALAWRFGRASGEPSAVSVPRSIAIAAALLVVVGVALRVASAHGVAVETDEARVYAVGGRVFDGDHDAWLHPPLFRALELAWVEHLGGADTALALRAPALAFAITGLVLFVAALVRRWPRWTTLVAALPVVVGAAVVRDGVLARPYAAAVCVLAAVVAPLLSRRFTRLHLVAVVAGAGLLFWIDTLFGATAATLAIVVLARQRRLALGGVIAAAVVVALWAAPTVPGAWQAARHATLPGHDLGGQIAAAQAPAHGMGRGSVPGLIAATASLAAFGVDTASAGLGVLAVIVVAGVVASAARRPEARGWLLALALAFAACVMVGSVRSVRPRNLLFVVPLLSVAAAWALPALVERARPRRSGAQAVDGER